MIDDPDDDSSGEIEVTAVRAGSDNAEVSMAIDFGGGINVADATGFLFLDTD